VVSVCRYQPAAEALALLLVTFPLAVGLHLPTLWLLIPIALITLTKRPYAMYGLSWERAGGIGFHAAVIAGVFIPYAFGHWLFARWCFGATFHLRVPESFWESILDQTLVIALPEEFFFRGYLQTQLDQVFGTPYRLLGAPIGAGMILAAAVFAVCHVLYGGPIRLIVFFPGLLYGWLRARTGTIAVPILYHAGSNLLMQIMLASLSA
jgi:membrane protease YdiL (CAAX protease family)